MDPVSFVVWAAIAFVLVFALIGAVRAFGRLVRVVLGFVVLAALLGLVFNPVATMGKIHIFVANVDGLIHQLRMSLGL